MPRLSTQGGNLEELQARTDFLIAKIAVKKILEAYSSPYKFSIYGIRFFGHHHEKRVCAVIEAVNNCNKIDEIKTILEQQRNLLTQKNPKPVNAHQHLDKRWHQKITNKPYQNDSSGYLKAIKQAIEALKNPNQFIGPATPSLRRTTRVRLP